MTAHTMWIAESDNGTVQFDTEPSISDVMNCCDDLDMPIQVYQVELIETSRRLMFAVDEMFPIEDDDDD